MTGKELREIRQRLGLTQVAFAELADVSQHTISTQESGIYPISRKVEDKARELAGLPPLPPLPSAMSGKEFRNLRQLAGLSQPQLGKCLGRSFYFISRVECAAQKVPDEIAAQMRQLFGHLMTAPQPRAPRKPLPFCRRCLCWNAAPGLPCGCPGGHPGTNGATHEARI